MIRAWKYRPFNAAAKGACSFEGDPVAPESLATALDDARSESATLLLVDVTAPSSDELDLIAEYLSLHALVRDDLHGDKQRTKLVQRGDQFHVAIQMLAPIEDHLTTCEVDLVFGQDWLLMVRHGEPENDATLEPGRHRFESIRAGIHGDDLGLLLWALLDTVIDGYFVASEWLDDCLESIEDVVFDHDVVDTIPKEIFTVRRDLVRFRHATAPIREVTHALSRPEVPWLGSDSTIRMNDLWDYSMRVADALDTQRDLLAGMLGGHLAIVSNRMNDAMKKMSSWGALILVPSLIAGIYGMNFQNMFLQNTSWGYPAALILMVTVTSSLAIFFRRKQWL
ncbi:MAG: hypothetical protein EXQ69_00315 [Acidimicrobiia bacterium]|nr:hypothetical protein [Acidimicrobiia bacterium]